MRTADAVYADHAMRISVAGRLKLVQIDFMSLQLGPQKPLVPTMEYIAQVAKNAGGPNDY